MATSQRTFKIVNSQPDMAEALEYIQRACFPTISDNDIITAEHYRAHIEVFPEGQFAVLDEDKVVACSTDFITTINFVDFEHRYIDAVANNWLSNHNPQDDWLYGADIGVHPDYRGLGISKLLYRARHDLVRKLKLRGHVAGGMLKGYGKVKHEMTVETYVAKVEKDEMFDPTLSVQLKRGFKVHGIIQNYIEASSSDNKVALIVWHNPDYQKT